MPTDEIRRPAPAQLEDSNTMDGPHLSGSGSPVPPCMCVYMLVGMHRLYVQVSRQPGGIGSLHAPCGDGTQSW